MNTQELRNLQEAYMEVYSVDEATAMAKRGYDEAPIRQKIAKSTGGGEAADRASALEKKSTFGNAKKEQQRQNLARAQRGDFRKTTSSSPGLHGYGHKSDDPKVQAKQAARAAQRSALTPAEKKQLNREEFDLFDVILEHLISEGYADTNEAALAIMANMSEEWKQNIMEISDRRVEAARNAMAKRTNRSVTSGNQYSRNVSREARMNARIQSRNERTGSNVEPTDTRRHQ